DRRNRHNYRRVNVLASAKFARWRGDCDWRGVLSCSRLARLAWLIVGKVVTISQAEKDRFAKLFDDGLTYKGLANEFNRAVETMRAWRRRLGLPPRQRKGFPSQNKHYTGFYLDAETETKLVFVARR